MGHRVLPDLAWLDVAGAVVDGALAQTHSVTDVPGLCAVGMPWQSSRGSALLGPLHEEQGHAWQHFGAPDGHVWEVTHRPVDSGRLLVEGRDTSLRQVGGVVLLERAGQVGGRAVLTQLDEPARRHWRNLQLEASAEDVDVLLACVQDVARELGAQAVQTTVAPADGVLLMLWLGDRARRAAAVRCQGPGRAQRPMRPRWVSQKPDSYFRP